jgi:hypothetical protein
MIAATLLLACQPEDAANRYFTLGSLIAPINVMRPAAAWAVEVPLYWGSGPSTLTAIGPGPTKKAISTCFR